MPDTNTTATNRPLISPTLEVAFVFAVAGLLIAVLWFTLSNIDSLQGAPVLFALGPFFAAAIAVARWVEGPKFRSIMEESRMVLAYALLTATWPLVVFAALGTFLIANHLSGISNPAIGVFAMFLAALIGALLLTLALSSMTTVWDWKTFAYLLALGILGVILVHSAHVSLRDNSDPSLLRIALLIAFHSTLAAAIFGLGLLRAQSRSSENSSE
jgi:hypothetical protein